MSIPSCDHDLRGAAERDTHAAEMRCIIGVLASLRRAVHARVGDDRITLRDLIVAMDKNSFPALLLVFSLLLVSPLSAIPGATTIFGLTIASILAQLVVGRPHAWLPRVLLDRPLPVARTLSALDRLEKPAGWLGYCLRTRLSWVTETPLILGPMILAMMAALCAPLMEVIPMSGTSVGAAITLFSASLLARDGLFVLVGACLAAIMPLALWLLLT
jgi:hypothetical protein